jgi:predicted Fe-S protein YdhL (DUF1289 family)
LLLLQNRQQQQQCNDDDDDGLDNVVGDVPATANSVRVGVPITPCTRICRYNRHVYDGRVCIGCYRESYEVTNWQSFGPAERYLTLLDAVDRLDETTTQTNQYDKTLGGTTTTTDRDELLRQAEYWKEQWDANAGDVVKNNGF